MIFLCIDRKIIQMENRITQLYQELNEPQEVLMCNLDMLLRYIKKNISVFCGIIAFREDQFSWIVGFLCICGDQISWIRRFTVLKRKLNL